MPHKSVSADVIVVGAGVIGMMTAYLLTQQGRKVIVMDRADAGREASWAGGGILAPLRPWDYPEAVWALCDRSRQVYPALTRALYAESGIDPQCLDTGGVLVGASDAERRRAIEWHQVKQLACSPLANGDLWMPWIHQVRNPRLCKALLMTLQRMGVPVLVHCAVRHLIRDQDRVIGVETQKGAFFAPDVVLAAGAWSAQLAGAHLPVQPVRGQMLRLRSKHALPPMVHLLPNSYVIVRADGTILTGSTMETAGFSKDVTADARARLESEAVKHVDGLRGSVIEQQWSGLRPGSPDGIPFIGADAHTQGLWLNTGHHRNGLAMAPASAERLVSAMLKLELSHQLTGSA